MKIFKFFANFAEKTVAEIFISLIIKSTLVFIFGSILYFFEGINIISWQFGLFLSSAIFVWFVEFENELITDYFCDRFIKSKKTFDKQ